MAVRKSVSVFSYTFPQIYGELESEFPLPSLGLLLIIHRDSKSIKNGRMDLEVVIMDAEGDIVALSHHIAFAVSVERNLATRRTGASKI